MLKLLIILSFFISHYAKTEEILVVTEHLPPYQITSNGKLIGGSSYQIMEEVIKRANISAKTVVLPWVRAYKTALNEPNTIIYSITRSEERDRLLQWIGKLHHLEYSFFSTKANRDLKVSNLKDALKYSVVSVRGSFEASSLQQKGFELGVNLILVVDYLSAWKMVQLGRADLTYGNAPVLSGDSIDETFFKRQGPVIETFDLYAAANLKTPKSLIDKLSTALVTVKQDRLYKHLFKKETHQ